MLDELIEWRREILAASAVKEPKSTINYTLAPVIWREYVREDIPALFGVNFSSGSWNAGIVRLEHDLILLTTLRKGNLSVGGHYEDRFLGPQRLEWQSQTKTRRDSQVGRIIGGTESDYRVHLFVRAGKLREGKAAPFLYCGQPQFVSWVGEQPITVIWVLSEPVPEHLRPMRGVR